MGMLSIIAMEQCLFIAASAFVMATTANAGLVAVANPLAPLRGATDITVDVHDGASNYASSNTTHCGWVDDHGKKSYEEMAYVHAWMTKYLYDNIMPYDVPRARTLGFDPDIMSSLFIDGNDVNNDQTSAARIMKQQSTVDGLSDGILNQTLYYSIHAKTVYPWTDAITKAIYMEYIVPYAVVNEPRSDHRPLLFNALKETLKDFERPAINNEQTKGQKKDKKELTTPQDAQKEMKKAVKLINTRLWSLLGRSESKPIQFVAGLTPRIYDPLSVIAYGHSSCTGLAVLLIAALRSVGIPARMAGTPAWYDSWVEVWVPNESGGEWIFLEPTPGIAEGDEDTADADDLDRHPCKRWFCKADRFNGSTKVFATRFDKTSTDTHYPMAWSVGDEGVPGEDRSDYYNNVCGQCS